MVLPCKLFREGSSAWTSKSTEWVHVQRNASWYAANRPWARLDTTRRFRYVQNRGIIQSLVSGSEESRCSPKRRYRWATTGIQEYSFGSRQATDHIHPTSPSAFKVDLCELLTGIEWIAKNELFADITSHAKVQLRKDLRSELQVIVCQSLHAYKLGFLSPLWQND